jgi:hypothetical protein
VYLVLFELERGRCEVVFEVRGCCGAGMGSVTGETASSQARAIWLVFALCREAPPIGGDVTTSRPMSRLTGLHSRLGSGSRSRSDRITVKQKVDVDVASGGIEVRADLIGLPDQLRGGHPIAHRRQRHIERDGEFEPPPSAGSRLTAESTAI